MIKNVSVKATFVCDWCEKEESVSTNSANIEAYSLVPSEWDWPSAPDAPGEHWCSHKCYFLAKEAWEASCEEQFEAFEKLREAYLNGEG